MPLKVESPPTTLELTLEDWYALPEDETGELVDGKLVEEEVPSYVHEMVVGFLIEMLRRWVRPQGGVVGGSGAKFAVAPRRGRKPDVTVYLPSSLPPPQGLIHSPPYVAVEVVSPTPRDGRRDRVEKLDEYAAFGISFYWIVDPELRSFQVFELRDDERYVHALGATAGKLEDVPGCKGLTLDLDALWAEIDLLKPEAKDADAG